MGFSKLSYPTSPSPEALCPAGSRGTWTAGQQKGRWAQARLVSGKLGEATPAVGVQENLPLPPGSHLHLLALGQDFLPLPGLRLAPPRPRPRSCSLQTPSAPTGLPPPLVVGV